MTEVEKYYDEQVEREWQRMDRHPMEFHTTIRAMAEFLPKGCKVLDVGGGPGRYAIHLAQQDYQVTLLDLSKGNVEFARRKAKELGIELNGYVHGNALDLGQFADASFDAVLVMGPLYHLIEEKDRRQAIAEAKRVLKPGGLIFLAFISRYAPVVDYLRNYPELIGEDYDDFLRLLDDGININSVENPGFTTAYFIHPMEIEPLARNFGFETLRLAAAEGPMAVNAQPVNALPPELFEKWVDLMYHLGTQSIFWGATEHMLYIGRKS